MKIRIGQGYDVHKLEKGAKLMLGGVHIPHESGSVGHSDADTLLHAICDAVLGAINARDIGHHFPDTDPRWKGKDSAVFLKEAVRLAKEKGYAISNIDATVCLQKPKLASHIEVIKKNIAQIAGMESDDISVKATTTERLGFVGREEGVAVLAVALVVKGLQ